MKTIYKILNFIIRVSLACFLLFIFFEYCGNQNNVKVKRTVIIKTDTIMSEVTKTEFIYDTVIKENVILQNDTIYLNNKILVIDTIFVYLDEFLSHKFYSDTIKDDSTAFLVVNDTLYKNSIKHRQIVLKTFNKTITSYQEKNGFYLGAGITGFKEPIYNIGIDYKFKKVIVGVGFNTNEQILINLKYKIK